MNTIPVISLSDCTWFKDRKVLTYPSSSTVRVGTKQFFVKSHTTGREIRFAVINEYDKLFDQDQWDGEQQIYRPTTTCAVDHLIVYNQG
jgi:hypothetical protein